MSFPLDQTLAPACRLTIMRNKIAVTLAASKRIEDAQGAEAARIQEKCSKQVFEIFEHLVALEVEGHLLDLQHMLLAENAEVMS